MKSPWRQDGTPLMALSAAHNGLCQKTSGHESVTGMVAGRTGAHDLRGLAPRDAELEARDVALLKAAAGEPAIQCPSPLDALKYTPDQCCY